MVASAERPPVALLIFESLWVRGAAKLRPPQWRSLWDSIAGNEPRRHKNRRPLTDAPLNRRQLPSWTHDGHEPIREGYRGTRLERRAARGHELRTLAPLPSKSSRRPK
jgi:hypothetical protein